MSDRADLIVVGGGPAGRGGPGPAAAAGRCRRVAIGGGGGAGGGSATAGSNSSTNAGGNGSGKTFLLKAIYTSLRTLEEYKRGNEQRYIIRMRTQRRGDARPLGGLALPVVGARACHVFGR